MSSTLGTLWIVATPLGNHGDLSARAQSVLEQVPYILAEDTRNTKKLMQQCGIRYQSISSFHEHNEKQRLTEVLAMLQQGNDIALVSDAGTPLLSDPGFRLVQACREQNIPVKPIPGPSAPIAALSASGLPPIPHAFLGFAPRKESELQRFFAPYATMPITLIFFDRKDRLARTLTIAESCLGNRKFCIARELTKTYEEFISGYLSTDLTLAENLLGELTVIIGPPEEIIRTPEEVVLGLARQELLHKGKPKDIIKRIQNLTHGWTAKELYEILHQIQ